MSMITYKLFGCCEIKGVGENWHLEVRKNVPPLQHLQKTGGRGVLWLTSFLCLPTFRAARGAVAAKGTCPSALGFLCFLRVSALDSSLYRSPVTSHQSRTAIPLSQTEQPTAPSPMHIIIV